MVKKKAQLWRHHPRTVNFLGEFTVSITGPYSRSLRMMGELKSRLYRVDFIWRLHLGDFTTLTT